MTTLREQITSLKQYIVHQQYIKEGYQSFIKNMLKESNRSEEEITTLLLEVDELIQDIADKRIKEKNV